MIQLGSLSGSNTGRTFDAMLSKLRITAAIQVFTWKRLKQSDRSTRLCRLVKSQALTLRIDIGLTVPKKFGRHGGAAISFLQLKMMGML